MRLWLRNAFLILACAAPFASAQDALLNERPVMPRAEYERLWQVDCAIARNDLLTAAVAADVEQALTLVGALQRCAWIDAAMEKPLRHAVLLDQLQAWLDGTESARLELVEALRR